MILTLPANIWTDIYAITGKHRHNKLKIQNQNNSIIYLSNSGTQPLSSDIGEVVPALDISESYANNLWVKSVDKQSTIAVIEDITADSNRVDDSIVRFVEQKSVLAGVLTPVITLKNKTTFNSAPNNYKIEYATVSLATDGTKPVYWNVITNAALTGAVFVDQDTANSIAQYDVSATAISGGNLVGGVVMNKSESTRINLLDGDVTIQINPGETITLAAKSVNNTIVDVFLTLGRRDVTALFSLYKYLRSILAYFP